MATADSDAARWSPRVVVDKWSPEQVARARELAGHDNQLTAEELQRLVGDPAEVIDADGNLLTTAGVTRLVSILVGAGGQQLTNTATRIGVGNSATAAAVGQTDLQAAAGAGNRFFQPMDATYPQAAAGVATFRSTFGTGDANFVWSEWGIDVGTPTVAAGTTVGAVLVNRKVAALGEKVAGAQWTLTATITIA